MHQPEDILSIYGRNAEAFDQQRAKTLFEKSWIDSFLAFLKPKSTILDLGCGAGEPIAAYLIEGEPSVVGVDFSSEVLRFCKFRFTGQQWI